MTAANNLLAAAIETRLFHEDSQSDATLFQRLCPPPKKGGENTGDYFAPAMRRRLIKLGYGHVQHPDELSLEQRTALVRLDLDPSTITWQRVLDTCDRHLRRIEIGLGSQETIKSKLDPTVRVQHSRMTGFDITVPSWRWPQI